jgi:tripartite-type tricarboxylate transporter receptor subunit TctC
VCCAAFLASDPRYAQATDRVAAWPVKPIRLIIPYAPGGLADIITRVVGQKISDNIGQPVIPDYRSGAGGNIGTALAARAAPDGYTALVTAPGIVVNPSLFPDAGYDVERDFIPTAIVARQPILVVVNATFPAKTLTELLTLAKSSGLTFATPGSGSPPHLTGERLFNLYSRLGATPIHFRGAGPEVAALLTGEPAAGVVGIASPLPHIKSGRLRALAVSGASRTTALPDVPTLAESGFPTLQDYLWIGLFLPSGTPVPIVQKLNEAVNHALQSQDVRDRLEAQVFEPVGGSLQWTAEYVRTESMKWTRVVRESGARPD